ncbi:MAG TPA: hypothetical protein VGE74_12035, partial [Gemmata sp.]
MSGRTVSPLTFTAALLFAALAPAGAQEGARQAPLNSGGPPTMAPPVPPLPRLPTMSPPAPPATVETGAGARVVGPNGEPVKVERLPVVKGPFDHRQVFNFSVGLFGEQNAPPCNTGTTGGIGSYCAPALPRLQQPAPFVAGPGSIRLVAAEDVLMAQPTCPPCPLPKIAPNALLGTWYREVPVLGVQVVATFTHDELKLCVTHPADARTVTITATAHYTLTPDGLVFGVITGGDIGIKGEPEAATATENEVELALLVQTLVDAPFSFRTKATSAGLMVSGVKCGVLLGSDAPIHTQLAFGGLFKSAKDGKVPAPAVPQTDTSKAGPFPPGATRGAVPADGPIGSSADKMPPPIPAAQPIERVGIDFGPNPPVMDAPCPPKPIAPPASRAPVSADSTKQLAEDAFGQLLQQSGVTRPASGMTLPSGKYLEHYPQYFPPDPAFPLPRELASQEAPGCVRPTSAIVAAGPAKVSPIGTWYRDVAGKQCVVKVTPDHLTLTVHDAQEIDGKVSTASLVITADYHTARDGITAVGLITSVDVNFEGEFPPEDSKPFFEMLSELQKVLEDKPFALTFRMYGEALVIGNVRMPQVSDRMDVQPAGYMAGRYKIAGDRLPKPKPTKMPTEFKVPGVSGAPNLGGSAPGPSLGPLLGAPGLILPSDTGTGSALRLLPPAGASPEPNCNLLPPQRIPTPPQRVIPSGASEPYPQMGEPMKPVPQMPQPTPPPGLSSDKAKRVPATDFAVGWQPRIAYLPDPTKNGRVSPGLAGQMFLFGGPKLEFAQADGVLTVDLVDDTPRPPGQSPATPATPERWQFDKSTLCNLQIRDETFGKSYVLFLPWPAYKSDITRVKISARYDPEIGPTLFATPSTVRLEVPAKPIPQMPQPTPPAGYSLNEGSKPERSPSSPARRTFLGIQTCSSDPNIIRMEQLLYQSEDLPHLQNEWRRFWFNDQPSHLTP